MDQTTAPKKRGPKVGNYRIGHTRGGESYAAKHKAGIIGQSAEHYITSIVKAVITSGVQLPLVFLLDVMNDESLDLDYRLEAARVAAPYIHRKMPIALETTNEKKLTLMNISITADRLKDLTDDELASLSKLAERIAAPRLDPAGAEEASFVETSEVLPGQGPTPPGALHEAPGVLQSGGDTP